jgi:ATP-dependent DNA helicase RecQ
MDEEQVADIFNYFKDDAASDSMEEAIAELGDDYEVAEIRLIRIKFLAEMGN